MMVKAQIASPGGPVSIALISARQEPVPESEFVISAGYKEMGVGMPSSTAGTAPAAPVPAATAPAAPAIQHDSARFSTTALG